MSDTSIQQAEGLGVYGDGAISRWAEGSKSMALLTCIDTDERRDLARHILNRGTVDDIVWLLTMAKRTALDF